MTIATGTLGVLPLVASPPRAAARGRACTFTGWAFFRLGEYHVSIAGFLLQAAGS